MRNKALLGKQLWGFPRDNKVFWYRVILSIYELHSNGWDTNTVVRWLHYCTWTAITQVFDDNYNFNQYLMRHDTKLHFLRGYLVW